MNIHAYLFKSLVSKGPHDIMVSPLKYTRAVTLIVFYGRTYGFAEMALSKKAPEY